FARIGRGSELGDAIRISREKTAIEEDEIELVRAKIPVSGLRRLGALAVELADSFKTRAVDLAFPGLIREWPAMLARRKNLHLHHDVASSERSNRMGIGDQQPFADEADREQGGASVAGFFAFEGDGGQSWV